MNRFEDKVVLVTGAASGIGAATAELFRREGATVVPLDLRATETTLACDVTDQAQVLAAVSNAVAEHGGIDVVANVAGMVRFSHVGEMPLQLWQQHLDLNLTGPFLVSQACLPTLVERMGCIVNVASIAGLRGQAYTAAYCASKGGLVLLTKSMALELSAAGVRVNAVCPGGVDTPLLMGVATSFPDMLSPELLARLGGALPGLTDAEEVAEAIAYLASGAARSITGTALVMDRGTQC